MDIKPFFQDKAAMKTIRLQYLVLLCSMLFLALLWEFWLEDVALFYFSEEAKLESLYERLEYVATVFVLCVVSLLYPYVQASRGESVRKKSALERERLIVQLQDALAEIKTLRGIIPICSYCKKIHDNKDVWTQLEAYLCEHSDAQFSHGACPDCLQQQLAMIAHGPDSDKD
jgi:hypothetical protein